MENNKFDNKLSIEESIINESELLQVSGGKLPGGVTAALVITALVATVIIASVVIKGRSKKEDSNQGPLQAEKENPTQSEAKSPVQPSQQAPAAPSTGQPPRQAPSQLPPLPPVRVSGQPSQQPGLGILGTDNYAGQLGQTDPALPQQLVGKSIPANKMPGVRMGTQKNPSLDDTQPAGSNRFLRGKC